MAWIVIGEKDGLIELVSKSDEDGILPKGSYLTIEYGSSKFILRVDKSLQSEPYAPSPMIVDMDLAGLAQDQKCQNIIRAFRVMDVNQRTDGKIDFIRPQSIARRSTQEEVNLAMNSSVNKGPKVFVATVYAGQNQLLVDDKGAYITAMLPEEMFYHQIQICGKTGSGKTVATKYLAQYFAQEMSPEGAVLAINVKEADFLRMDQKSVIKNDQAIKEWELIGKKPKGISNYKIYYPATIEISDYSLKGVNPDVCEKITLSVHTIDPESLVGLLQGITEAGALALPDIFRYWQQDVKRKQDRFVDFQEWFRNHGEEDLVFPRKNIRGDILSAPLHSGTYNSLMRILSNTAIYFDNERAVVIDEKHILERGKMSVIHVGDNAMQFGAVVLRHLLNRIVDAKSKGRSQVPVLIIIDEVHNFYNTSASYEALGVLDTICRQGRSSKTGVIFSSQNPDDIPSGLESVINTKIIFKSDYISTKISAKVSRDEVESLKKGFAIASVHELTQLRIMKFPVSLAGVFEE